MKPIFTRTISGIAIIALFVLGVIINEYTFLAFFSIFIIIGIYEFHLILKKKDIKIPFVYCTIAGLLIFGANFMYAQGILESKYLLLIIPLIVGIYAIGLFSKNNSFTNITYSIISIIYIVLPLSILNYIVFRDNHAEYNYQILLAFTILIWVYDTFAYLFGITLGKHKLFVRISPLKTWEGFIGGGLTTIGFAFIIAYFFKDLNIYNWIIIAAITVLAGTFGDLFESMLKRSMEVKDSSKIIPGHGGMLDRFDSFLIVSLFVFLYLQFI